MELYSKAGSRRSLPDILPVGRSLAAATVVAGIAVVVAVAAECAEQKDQDQPVAGIAVAAKQTVVAAATAVVIVAEEQ